MPPPPPPARSDADLLTANRRFYDALWKDARLVEPQCFNTWPLVSALAMASRRRLEVAPGLRPRLPIEGTCFVDISVPALEKLRSRMGQVAVGSITALPFKDQSFDLVCAMDIIEHVDDDAHGLAELERVTAPGGAILIATPLHPSRWTLFDDFVGHRRRYVPETFIAKLGENGIHVEQSAVYGMQPKSSRVLGWGMWWLTHHRDRAMWWYNRVIMPLAVRWEKKLIMVPGLIDTGEVDEVLIVCRKTGPQLL